VCAERHSAERIGSQPYCIIKAALRQEVSKTV
jgi:hypothetical protein